MRLEFPAYLTSNPFIWQSIFWALCAFRSGSPDSVGLQPRRSAAKALDLHKVKKPFGDNAKHPSRTEMPSQVLASLEAHLKEHHVNKYALNVESKDLHYSEWKENYSKESAEPLAIVRPQSAEDVAVVVSYCVEQRLDFHVRAGGHDLFGRSTVQDSVMIDLRDMNYVRIDDDKLTAKVGGGNKFEHLVEELEKEEMFTPSGIKLQTTILVL